jgi:hypothetical protein
MRLGWGSSGMPVRCYYFRDGTESMLTFLLPPVRVTFTKRRVYVILFFARPLGVFFFSWGSTYESSPSVFIVPASYMPKSSCSSFPRSIVCLPSTDSPPTSTTSSLPPLNRDISYLWCLRLDLSGTSERSVNFSHDCGLSGCDVRSERGDNG